MVSNNWATYESSESSDYVKIFHNYVKHVNPFVPNAPFLYPLKTSENLTVFLRFSDVFSGHRKGALGTNEFIQMVQCIFK